MPAPAVNSGARKAKLLKEGEPNLAGEYIREGLGMVVSVKVGGCLLGGWMGGWVAAGWVRAWGVSGRVPCGLEMVPM